MKPALREIVRSMPSPVDAIGATVHVNEACGIEIETINGRRQTKGMPTEVTSYPWTAILDEMTAQGYRPQDGEFVRADR